MNCHGTNVKDVCIYKDDYFWVGTDVHGCSVSYSGESHRN